MHPCPQSMEYTVLFSVNIHNNTKSRIFIWHCWKISINSRRIMWHILTTCTFKKKKNYSNSINTAIHSLKLKQILILCHLSLSIYYKCLYTAVRVILQQFWFTHILRNDLRFFWTCGYLTWRCFYESSRVWALPLPAVWVQAFPFLCHDSCFCHIYLFVSWWQVAPCLTKNNTDGSANHVGNFVSKSDLYLYVIIKIKTKLWWNYRKLHLGGTCCITKDSFHFHLLPPQMFKIQINLLLYQLFYMDMKTDFSHWAKNKQ
jgi:hypothetical protein